MLPQTQRSDPFHDDGLFHDQYANYNTRKNKPTDAQNVILDEADVDADESESYEDATDSSEDSSSSTTEDDTSSNGSDQFQYRKKARKKEKKSKKESQNNQNDTQHDTDTRHAPNDDDEDQLLFQPQSWQKDVDEDDDIFGLKCLMLVCLFCAALIISTLVGIVSTETSLNADNRIKLMDSNNTLLINQMHVTPAPMNAMDAMHSHSGHNKMDRSHLHRAHHLQPPTNKPTNKPTSKPSDAPTKKPTNKPSKDPSSKPTKKPRKKPSDSPTNKPVVTSPKLISKIPTKSPAITPEAIAKVAFEPSPMITKPPTLNSTKKPTLSPSATKVIMTPKVEDKVAFEPSPVVTKPPSRSPSAAKVSNIPVSIAQDVANTTTAIKISSMPDRLKATRNEQNPLKPPLCPNSIFTATSWPSISTPQQEICKKFTSGQTYLSPSEPDHVITASFDCALEHESQTCETDFGEDYKVNVLHGFSDLSASNFISVDMECVADADIFEPVYFTYGPYDNNENYMECIRVQIPSAIHENKDENRELWLRDYDTNDPTMHSLRIEFEMLEMDVEQGFDDVFLSWKYNNIYKHHYVHWTGKNTRFQSTPGIKSSNTLFWNVLSGDHLQICLNLKSDQDITGDGFKGVFSIRQDLGHWSEWSACETAPSANQMRYGAQCGIGIRNKTKTCPSYMDKTKNIYNDGNRICVAKEQSLNEFCTKAKCEAFNNTAVKHHKKLKEFDLEWRWNGKHRVDAIYPDPFRYILASNTAIDIDFMIEQIESKMHEIASRYSDERILTYGIGKGINNYETLEARVEARLLQSLLLGRRFVVTFTGSSNTAGHDNMFMSSYPMQLLSILRTFWASIGYNGAAFHVHNVAEGGHLGTKKLGWCAHQFAPQDTDMIFWESLMNDAGDKTNYAIYERWLRNVLSLPKNPIWGVISTGEAADRYGDRCYDKPYCKIADGVNMYWWKTVRRTYTDASDMLFIGARRGCYALADKVPECTGLKVSWHPSPNGHRLYAETFAYWFLNVALNGLKKHQNTIEAKMISSNRKPTVELECFLHDPAYKDGNNEALPHAKGKYCGGSCQESPNWCTSSYIPMNEEKRMHNWIVSNEDWSLSAKNGDSETMAPLIWRRGGQASIDHKVTLGTKEIGAELVLRVNVKTCCIAIMVPQKNNNLFEFSVNNKVVNCKYEGKTSNGWQFDAKSLDGCVIEAEKGKQDLKIKYLNATSSKRVSIDMIATF